VVRGDGVGRARAGGGGRGGEVKRTPGELTITGGVLNSG